MNSVKHNQKFYTLHSESFFYPLSDIVKKETGESEKLLSYYDVIPLFVYSINNNCKGEERFDLSPVDFSLEENKTHDHWKWKREYKYSEIGVDIFNTEKEAWEAYDKRFSEKQKENYKELKELRKILKK